MTNLYPITQLSDTEYSVELDMAHCITLGEFLEHLEQHNLRLGKFTARGPAGGNPLVELIGSKSDLDHLISQIPT